MLMKRFFSGPLFDVGDGPMEIATVVEPTTQAGRLRLGQIPDGSKDAQQLLTLLCRRV